MLSKVSSAALFGIEAYPVEVEIEVALGLPKLTFVGLADAAVRESGERVRAAIRNAGYQFPSRRITINLAPASRRKGGSLFDLPIALGILLASEQLPAVSMQGRLVAGELSLDGKVRPIRGALSVAILAKEKGAHELFLPEANAKEAAAVKGLSVYPLKRLADLVGLLLGRHSTSPCKAEDETTGKWAKAERPDFSEVAGQEGVKRALLIAVAGGHHLLMIGPPGSGKTMLARRVPTILPPMSHEEVITTSRIYSLIGALNNHLIRDRPFRSPHHSITPAGFVGGGNPIHPGELSLSHNGVLFMDELPEFGPRLLDMLRQPIEEGRIVLSRARGRVAFPCCILLVAAMNPCPCGHYGFSPRACQCTPFQIRRYRARISGPILDRIDLHVEVPRISSCVLSNPVRGLSSLEIREKVLHSRAIQKERYAGMGISVNAMLTPKFLPGVCNLERKAEEFLKRALKGLRISARAYHKILKIARTISDVEGSRAIKKEHLLEAIQYRVIDRMEEGSF